MSLNRNGQHFYNRTKINSPFSPLTPHQVQVRAAHQRLVNKHRVRDQRGPFVNIQNGFIVPENTTFVLNRRSENKHQSKNGGSRTTLLGRTGEVQTEEKKADILQSAIIWSPVPPKIICETKRLFGSFTEKNGTWYSMSFYL